MAPHVQGHPADQGQVLGRVVATRPTVSFPTLHIQDPVRLMFDPPVTADGGGEPVRRRKRAEEIATVGTDLIADDPGELHPADRLQPGPVRFRIEPVGRLLRAERRISMRP